MAAGSRGSSSLVAASHEGWYPSAHMQHAEIIFKNAIPEKKRKMVDLVSSNLLLADGTIEYRWRKPFDMLAVKGQEEKWCTGKESNLRPRDS
jgi:hypothetical protein